MNLALPSTVTGKRVMILEDDEDVLGLEEIILMGEGYNVIPFNHYQSPEYMIDFMPEVILLDVRLGDGYGHLLCKELKDNPNTSNIPVILVSGSTNLEHVAEEYFADSYLSKPFNINELVDAVKQYD